MMCIGKQQAVAKTLVPTAATAATAATVVGSSSTVTQPLLCTNTAAVLVEASHIHYSTLTYLLSALAFFVPMPTCKCCCTVITMYTASALVDVCCELILTRSFALNRLYCYTNRM
jgi:hypothetical protein